MRKPKAEKHKVPIGTESGFVQIGKAKARKEFLPLVDSIATSNTPIEITDNGKPVAVILGSKLFRDLYEQATKKKSKHHLESLDGSVTILGDLEQARRQLERETTDSINRRSKLL
jgi:prevent-host-death family protein